MKPIFFFLAIYLIFSSCSSDSHPDKKNAAAAQNDKIILDSDLLNDMVSKIEEENINIHSIVIIKDGAYVLEKYFGDYTRESLHVTHHIINSVISCCIGICVDEGLINSTDEKIVTFFPEYTHLITDGRQYDITIRHLLTMSGGYQWESEHHDNPITEFVKHPNLVEYMFSCPLAITPGTVYHQNSGGIFLLTQIVEKVSGKTIADFVDEKLFTPLGITNYKWERDPIGKTKGPYALYMKSVDIAAYARLILNKGVWKRERIISEKWFSEALQVHFPLTARFPVFKDLGQRGAGYCWWIYQDMIMAMGHAGQHIYIIEKNNAVVVFVAEGWMIVPAQLYRDYIRFKK